MLKIYDVALMLEGDFVASGVRIVYPVRFSTPGNNAGTYSENGKRAGKR